jgi:UDP-N-acetylglucosamine 2-epimerase (hydrolysing)
LTRKILFLTGTRADFGKLKPLMHAVAASPRFELSLFVTGMHTLSRYGYTVEEVRKSGFNHVHVFMNQIHGEPMEMVLANTIEGLSRYIHEHKPNMLVVHGDRVEALAGAIVGSFQNLLVAHIEGGEVSGTIDGLIRHSISKLSHLHFVANTEAADRLRQLGENPDSIFVIGSPDIDVMLSSELPDLTKVKSYYGIPFDDYAIAIFHPVTTELAKLRDEAADFVAALAESGRNYVIIYPNNDEGCDNIFFAYHSLENDLRFRLLPSLRFEYFLTLLKHASFIIGNSSAGIREAPVYGVPTVNVGSRQRDRYHYPSILNADNTKTSILEAIARLDTLPTMEPSQYFGTGNSAEHFMACLAGEDLWQTPKQKKFFDVPLGK